MNSDTITVVPYIYKSKSSILKCKSLSETKDSLSTTKPTKKRTLDKLNYGTKAFKCYKIRRKTLVNEKRSKKLSLTPFEKRCRKHRRRSYYIHSDLDSIKDFPTFQSKETIRLKSHIYHTKRFVMKLSFGKYFLPIRNSGKGIKNLMNMDNKEKSFVHDLSYYRPLEIKGPKDEVAEFLSQFLDPDCDLIASLYNNKRNKYNVQEYEAIFHLPGEFPLSPVGPTTATVRTYLHQINNEQPRIFVQIWLWAHPLIFETIYENLIVSKSELDEAQEDPMHHTTITIEYLPIPMCRLRLINNHDMNLLTKQLLTVISKGHKNVDQSLLEDDEINSMNKYNYFKTLLQSKNLNNIWKNGILFAVDIPDPRLNYSLEPMDQVEASSGKLTWRKDSDTSPLWTKEDYDHYSTHEKILENSNNDQIYADHHHNQRKQTEDSKQWSSLFSQLSSYYSNSNGGQANKSFKTLIHQQNKPESKDLYTQFPIMITRHFHGKRSSLTENTLDGYSIILPVHYFTPIFNAVVKTGIQPIGLEEYHVLHQMHGVLSFPQDYIDTQEGKQYWQTKKEEHLYLNKAMPPGKRKDIYIAVTDKIQIENLAIVRNKNYARPLITDLSQLSQQDPQSYNLPLCPSLPFPTYLHILIHPLVKGIPMTGACLYLPSFEEIKSYVDFYHEKKLKVSNQALKYEVNKEKYSSIPCSNNIELNFLGVVTNGLYPRTNHRKNQFPAIGVCNFTKIYHHSEEIFGKFDYMKAHQLLFFRNSSSNRLFIAHWEFLQ